MFIKKVAGNISTILFKNMSNFICFFKYFGILFLNSSKLHLKIMNNKIIGLHKFKIEHELCCSRASLMVCYWTLKMILRNIIWDLNIYGVDASVFGDSLCMKFSALLWHRLTKIAYRHYVDSSQTDRSLCWFTFDVAV